MRHVLSLFLLLLGSALGCSGADGLDFADVDGGMPDTDTDADADVETEEPSPDGGTLPAHCTVSVSEPPSALELDDFYTKYIDARGVPVVGSAEVSDAAFVVACGIVSHMVSKRPDIVTALKGNRVRVGIIGVNELTTDMPEYADLYEVYPDVDWNVRARGLGATIDRPLSSVGEENLLDLPSDLYTTESIMVHEFAHSMFDVGLVYVPGLEEKQAELDTAYQAAILAGTFANTYAATNSQEYWAEGVQSWYNTNTEAIPSNGIHNAINTRDELKSADPGLAQLIGEVYPDDDYQVPP